MRKCLILFVTIGLLIPFVSAQQKTIKVACIGNSITEGYGASDPSETGYVAQLKILFGNRYIVENFGSSGATACRNTNKPYASLEIFHAAQIFEPNIVFIALGTNDSQPEVWNTGDYAKNFEADLTYICKKFEEMPTKPDIYLCLPAIISPSARWKHQPQVLLREITPLIRKIAKKNNYTIVSFNTALKDCNDCYSEDDKLHPNDKGHRLMAERAYVAVVMKNMEENKSK